MMWYWAARDTLSEAFSALVGRPLRTLLSLAAMAVAVGTVSLVLDGLTGFQDYARISTARTFGSETFVVLQARTVGLTRKEIAAKLDRNPPIRNLDVRFLERYGGELLISPVLQKRVELVAGARKAENVSLNGVSADMYGIRELGLAAGRFFSASQDLAGSPVIVLGAEVADRLYSGRTAVGNSVRLGGRLFQVVGVQERQGTLGGVSLDLYSWIPWRAFERVFGAPESRQVFLRPGPNLTAARAEDKARVLMRARRQLRPGDSDRFDLLTPEAARSFTLEISERIGAAGPPITFAALLAAVVVVTNTSLVSVSERTQEIGVRRALGATRRRITAEVLVESSLIGLVGGLVGLAGARAGLEVIAEALAFSIRSDSETAIWSLACAGAAGLVAGLYPARRAAATEVVNALREE